MAVRNWSTTAFMFPGQGSQVVGMGKDIADAYPVARQTFEQADDILGFSLSDLCFTGPEAELTDTINTQPALYVCGIAILRTIRAEIGETTVGFVAGHSLGELTALTAAGALSFEEGLHLVHERGRLMKEAGTQNPGAMAALLGVEADAVTEMCTRAQQQTGGILVLANNNCPGQIVISGDEATLDLGLELAKDYGVKRAVKLAVSIASHSPLMESAALAFREALKDINFQIPRLPVYGNVEAVPLADTHAVRHELEVQLTSSVRWSESVQKMIQAGAEAFFELGPSDVLCGLLKRIDRTKPGLPINTAQSLQQFIQVSR